MTIPNPLSFIRRFTSKSPSGEPASSPVPSKPVDPKTVQNREEVVAPGGPGEVSAQVNPAELFQHLEKQHQTLLTDFTVTSEQILEKFQHTHAQALESIFTRNPSSASYLYSQHQNALRRVHEQQIEAMKQLKGAHSEFMRKLQTEYDSVPK
ncbi:hypothetical protein [Candidatus Similichlamydia epinepheli]|uniref:hypothetical protein n=1 Tax=Candidatus Similichlamydia epinepheli TaxID=1903953 RepID=UPI000D352772|nr:hypothetical protein [Candidatus Similichlamydia epinepheli]